jgi:hypothetical protein
MKDGFGSLAGHTKAIGTELGKRSTLASACLSRGASFLWVGRPETESTFVIGAKKLQTMQLLDDRFEELWPHLGYQSIRPHGILEWRIRYTQNGWVWRPGTVATFYLNEMRSDQLRVNSWNIG